MLSETIELRICPEDAWNIVRYASITNPRLQDYQIEVWVDLEDSPGYRTELCWEELIEDYDDVEHYTVNNDHLQHYLYINDKEEQ